MLQLGNDSIVKRSISQSLQQFEFAHVFAVDLIIEKHQDNCSILPYRVDRACYVFGWHGNCDDVT